MAVHDWTRVNAGIFHHFHQRWIAALSDALNAGLLPASCYALAEQIVGNLGPDVLALQVEAGPEVPEAGEDGGLTTVALAPPPVRVTARTELDEYVRKQNTLVIRHSSGDRILALVEVVSPGNKASRHAIRAFLQKAVAALSQGYHLLLLDLLPPGRCDPQGVHALLWDEIADEPYQALADKPLTLASYDAGPPCTAYVNSVAVGDPLPDMPLFLEPGVYLSVPLEETYQTAWRNVPQRWREVVEGRADGGGPVSPADSV
jgi:hypothetical protein